jgi:hypothetical protein
VGSAATLVPRALLASPCPADGAPLAAPVFAALCCTLAASLGLPIEFALRARRGRGRSRDGGAGSDAADAPREATLCSYAPLVVPGILAAGGTLLQLAALVYLRASALAGLRGAFILFTAALSARLALKDAPRGSEEWRCIAASAGGALLVGLAAELQAAAGADGGGAAGDGGGAGSGAQMAVGLALSLCGYAVAAVQVAVEQRALEGLAPFSRWEILGAEGVVGAIACIALLAALALAPAAPLAAAGVDVPARVLACLRAAPLLPALGAAYGACSLALNALLLLLAAVIGPNYRVFIFTARGVLTFAVELALWYGPVAAARGFGQPASPYAALQLAGFALLIGGGARRLSAQQRRLQHEGGDVAAAAAGTAAAAGDGGSGGGDDSGATPLLAAEEVADGAAKPLAPPR